MKCDTCNKNLEENDLRFKYAGKILCEEFAIAPGYCYSGHGKRVPEVSHYVF